MLRKQGKPMASKGISGSAPVSSSAGVVAAASTGAYQPTGVPTPPVTASSSTRTKAATKKADGWCKNSKAHSKSKRKAQKGYDGFCYKYARLERFKLWLIKERRRHENAFPRYPAYGNFDFRIDFDTEKLAHPDRFKCQPCAVEYSSILVWRNSFEANRRIIEGEQRTRSEAWWEEYRDDSWYLERGLKRASEKERTITRHSWRKPEDFFDFLEWCGEFLKSYGRSGDRHCLQIPQRFGEVDYLSFLCAVWADRPGRCDDRRLEYDSEEQKLDSAIDAEARRHGFVYYPYPYKGYARFEYAVNEKRSAWTTGGTLDNRRDTGRDGFVRECPFCWLPMARLMGGCSAHLRSSVTPACDVAAHGRSSWQFDPYFGEVCKWCAPLRQCASCHSLWPKIATPPMCVACPVYGFVPRVAMWCSSCCTDAERLSKLCRECYDIEDTDFVCQETTRKEAVGTQASEDPYARVSQAAKRKVRKEELQEVRKLQSVGISR